jgi:hypothetical protein
MSDVSWRKLTLRPSREEQPGAAPGREGDISVWTRVTPRVGSPDLAQRLLATNSNGRIRDTHLGEEGRRRLQGGRVTLAETGTIDLRNPPQDPYRLTKLWVFLCCVAALLSYALKTAAARLGLKAPGAPARCPEPLSPLFMLGMPLPWANRSRECLIGARRVLRHLTGERAQALIQISRELQKEVEELEYLQGALASFQANRISLAMGGSGIRSSLAALKLRLAMGGIRSSLAARKQRVEAAWAQGKAARLVLPWNGNLVVLLLSLPVGGRTQLTRLQESGQGVARVELGDWNSQDLDGLAFATIPDLTQAGWCRAVSRPPMAVGCETLPALPGAGVIRVLEEVARSRGTALLTNEALAFWEANLCLALTREVGRAMMIASSFLRFFLATPISKFFADGVTTWNSAGRKLIGKLEGVIATATKTLGLPLDHPWSSAWHALAEACTVNGPSAVNGTRSVQFTLAPGSGKGQTALAYQIEQLAQTRRRQPARTAEDTVQALRNALRGADICSDFFIRRGRLFAELESLDVESLWPLLPALSATKTRELRTLLVKVRTKIRSLCKKTGTVTLEGREWMSLQKLAALESEVSRLRARQIQRGPVLTQGLQQAKQIIESHPMGGLFWPRAGHADVAELVGRDPFPTHLPADPIEIAPSDNLLKTYNNHQSILRLAASLRSDHDPQAMLRFLLPEMEELTECLHTWKEHLNFLDASIAGGYDRADDEEKAFNKAIGGWARRRGSHQNPYPSPINEWDHPGYCFTEAEKRLALQLHTLVHQAEQESGEEAAPEEQAMIPLQILAGTRTPKANWLIRKLEGEHWGTIVLPLRFAGDFTRNAWIRRLAEAQLRPNSALISQGCRARDWINDEWVEVDRNPEPSQLTRPRDDNDVWGEEPATRHPFFSQLGTAARGRPYLVPRELNEVVERIRGFRAVHFAQTARNPVRGRHGPRAVENASFWHSELRGSAFLDRIEIQDSDLLAARAVSLLESPSTRLHQVMGLIANYPALLERPWFPGLFVRATTTLQLDEPVDPASAESLSRILQDILRRASQEVMRQPIRAADLCAWVARGLPHLPAGLRGALLDGLREPQELFDNRSLLDALVAQLPRLPLGAQHSLYHMAMVLDSVDQDGQTLLAHATSPETLLYLRAQLVREGDAITAWPGDGPRAEWLREARQIYLQQWIPSLSRLSAPQLQQLEESVARDILQPGARPLERRVNGGEVRYLFSQGTTQREIILDLPGGVVRLAQGTVAPPAVGYIPALALNQIPFLQALVGARSCFEMRLDSEGHRCMRIVGAAADATWIELVETQEGFRLRGRFPDPLRARSQPELWIWAPHPNEKTPLPHALTLYGLWQSADGKRTRLIASDQTLRPQLRDCYEARLKNDKLVGIDREGCSLWPSMAARGALGRLARLEHDCRVEGGTASSPHLLRFPSLHGMEIERVQAPRWARSYLKGQKTAYQVRNGQERLMWFPDGVKIASELFGGRFARSVLPLINEEGQAQLWIVPPRRARLEAQLPSLIKLNLTSANPDLAVLALDQPEALAQAALCAAAHSSAPVAFGMLQQLERAPAATLSEQQKNEILENLGRLLPDSDPDCAPLFRLRISLLALRWGLAPRGDLNAQIDDLANIGPLARLSTGAQPGPEHLPLLRPHLDPLRMALLEQLCRAIQTATPVATPLEAVPAQNATPLPPIPEADLRLSAPTEERLDRNRQPLTILYGSIAQDHTLGRLYRQSLQRQLDLNLPSLQQVEDNDETLRAWSRKPANQQAIARGAEQAERQASQQRSWILQALEHLDVPEMGSTILALRRGELGQQPQALSQLIRLWCSGSLTDQQAPGLSTVMGNYLCATCTASVLRRIQAAGQNPSRLRISLEQLRTLRPSLQDPLQGNEQARVLNRHRLAIQAERGIVVREEQIEAVQRILEPLAPGRNRAMQMRPGFGKTDIVMALALRTAHDVGQDWTAVVPEQLLSTTRRGLGRTLENLLTLQLHREALEGDQGITYARSCLQKVRAARASHTPLLTTAESLATLEVAIAQRLGDNATAEQLDLLRDLRVELRRGRILMDEADAILAPNRKLIFALGQRHAVPEQACLWMNRFMQRLASAPSPGEPAEVRHLKEAFAHQTTASLQINQPEQVKRATEWLVRQSLQDLGLAADAIALVLGDQPIPPGHELALLGPIVRQALIGSLPQVLAGAVQREYGISPGRLIGVPFKEGEEEADTQFSHLADQLAFTFAAASFQFPIDQSVLDDKWWQTLSALKGDEVNPQSRAHQLARRLEDLRRQAEQENLQNGGQSVTQILRRLVEQPENLDLRLEYAQKLLAPRIQTYRGSAHRRMSDIILGLDGVVGMTGTLRPTQLPNTFDASAADQDRGSSIEVHAALLKGNAAAAAASLPQIQHEAHAAQLLDDLVAPDATGEPQYQVVLNQACVGHRVGSRAIAERWARRYRRPVAFHDPQHRCPRRLIVPSESGELIETEFQDAPPESDVHARTLFYFGPSDLRGVNFVIPKAKAVFLPSPTVTDDSLEQAVRRMRGLGSRHTVDLCLPFGVAQALTHNGVTPTAQTWLRDVLRRTQEEERKLERGARDNEQAAQHAAEAASRWLEGTAPVQPNDLDDTLNNQIPLVEPTWSAAGWRGEQGAQQADRQVVRAVARQVAQALAIEACHIALPYISWNSLSGYDSALDGVWSRNGWSATRHQENAQRHGIPISQEVLVFLGEPDRRVGACVRPDTIESPILQPAGAPPLLVGSVSELHMQERRLRRAGMAYARLQQCLGSDLETARLRWEVVSASSPADGASALRRLQGHGLESLVCGSTRRALEARALALS